MVPTRRSILVVIALLAAGCDDGPPAPAVAPASIDPDPGLIRLAGSGAMTPLAAELARAWAARGEFPRVVVEPSVGSTGGVQAAADGAVDLGLVARPLRGEEQATGLTYLPVALDAVVVAAHRDVPVDDLSSADLERLFSGERTRFADGSPAVLVLRDRWDSAHGAFERMVPRLAPLRERAYETRRFDVVFHDDTMGAVLSSSIGAIGLFSLGAVSAWKLPIKVLSVDGVMPSVQRIQDGTWPATRELAFVFKPERRGRVQGFLDFVTSRDTQAAMLAWGYVPVMEARR